jgi:hypothetical protein
MPSRGKYFDIFDFPKFGRPNVIDIDPAQTAREVSLRLGDGGFMSYGSVWPHMGRAVSGRLSPAVIEAMFSFYRDEWKNENLREVLTLLRDFFGGRGTWYPMPSKPIYVLGFWFKPSIKGVWFVDGRAHAVAINARKHQPLSPDDVRFAARGIYELHCISDPNDPIPLILDLSAPTKADRVPRAYPVPVEEAITLEAFEHSVREFLVALSQVGLSLPPPPPHASIIDLFRR